jgi:type II secretory pathway predicted ATPase ExeA
MYRSFYGLTQNPFEKEAHIKPFESFDYIQVKERCKWLMETRGLGVITGKSGTGKTYAIRNFVSTFNNRNYKFYYVHSTSLTNIEFYRAVCNVFNIEASHRKVTMFQKIREFITNQFKDSRIIPVLIIDEAQYLNQGTLNDLSLLLNYEYDSRNFLTIILIGPDTLSNTLSRNINESLHQRITMNFELCGFSLDEFKTYITSGLEKAGCNQKLFDEILINSIYNFSQESVRVANRYLTLCLLAGAKKGETVISMETLKEVYNDINRTTPNDRISNS